MSLPPPAQNQPFCTVSALEAGHLVLDFHAFIDDASPGDCHSVPSLAFLLQHSSNQKRLLFDLGIRKDWENFPPRIVNWIKTVFPADIPQDVTESLVKGGLSPLDIDTVCLSHIHFDHCGDTTLFPKSELVVGGETAKLLADGLYPDKPDALFRADLLPADRTKYLGDNLNWEPIGPFPRAFDFYGDGSVYIIDSPGHLSGHVNLLARTSSDGAWIYLAGDTAHHWNLITGKSAIACGHPAHFHDSAHQDTELARQTIERVRKVKEIPRVRVLLAHDEPWYKENKNGSAFFPGTIPSLQRTYVQLKLD